jgi:hypothetical protein
MIVRITRVKVGNRQAPQQQTETPPKKVGFLRLRTTNRTGTRKSHSANARARYHRKPKRIRDQTTLKVRGSLTTTDPLGPHLQRPLRTLTAPAKSIPRQLSCHRFTS